MQIGNDTGEAFFVFETEEDAPQEFMTNSVLGPVQVHTGETAGNGNRRPLDASEP